MYKLIAIDLDGTLLNSYGEISEENKNAIIEAKKRGCKTIIASGRMSNNVKDLSLEIDSDEYVISGNGALIYDIKKDEIIYDKFIDKDKALNIIKICEENSIYYNIYTENDIITKSLNYNTLVYNNENSRKSPDKQTSINIVQDVYKYINENNINILKFTVCDGHQIIFNRIIDRLRKIPNIDVLDVAHMSRKIIKMGTEEINLEYFYTEISCKNVNKWNAIEFLINKLDIDKKDVIAIGDNVNDKEMVLNAGLGVAMGNSALSSMNLGDITVSDNNSNGVAEAINKFVNNI